MGKAQTSVYPSFSKISLKKTTAITDLCAKNFLAGAQVREFSLSSRAEIYNVNVVLLKT